MASSSSSNTNFGIDFYCLWFYSCSSEKRSGTCNSLSPTSHNNAELQNKTQARNSEVCTLLTDV